MKDGRRRISERLSFLCGTTPTGPAMTFLNTYHLHTLFHSWLLHGYVERYKAISIRSVTAYS